MKFFKSLLNEHGDISTMRLMSLLCCLTAIIIAIVGLNKAAPDYSGLSMLCGTFLGMAFLGKAIQKPSEAAPKASDDKE